MCCGRSCCKICNTSDSTWLSKDEHCEIVSMKQLQGHWMMEYLQGATDAS